MKNKLVFVIFGITGDLAKRKIIPAIYMLAKNKEIKDFYIIGIARRNLKESFVLSSEKLIKNVDRKILNKLVKNSKYVQLDFRNLNEYDKLKEKLAALEKKGFINKLFYFSTPPEGFAQISENLEKSGILKQKKGWKKAVFEKPFGYDLSSARKINSTLLKIFNEKEIYRIDHYLGKELVENILISRFTNRILEPLWNNKHIESVQIVLDETKGIEGRGSYYDKYGAIKDVVQNHMFQMLALVAMESPKMLEGDYIKHEKSKVLKNVKIKDVLLGQYEGYREEEKVAKNSMTETFAVLKAEINNKRWKGVPFFLKTGKFLEKKETKITLKFKKVKCLLTKSCPSDSNYLEIRIEPNEGISFEINAKLPGRKAIMPVKMEFCHSCVFGPNTPEAYENLFIDILNNNKEAFVSWKEIEFSWKIIDSIKKGKLYFYKRGSKGPKELEIFNKKHGLKWR